MIHFYSQKITIIRSRKPPIKSINEELKWLGSSLGLFNLRDKDKSCFRIFVELLKGTKAKYPLSSDEIAYNSHLSRGTVVHHLNRLMESGIVVRENERYLLRVDNLSELVDEIEKDLARACSDLKKVAAEIDGHLGL